MINYKLGKIKEKGNKKEKLHKKEKSCFSSIYKKLYFQNTKEINIIYKQSYRLNEKIQSLDASYKELKNENHSLFTSRKEIMRNAKDAALKKSYSMQDNLIIFNKNLIKSLISIKEIKVLSDYLFEISNSISLVQTLNLILL